VGTAAGIVLLLSLVAVVAVFLVSVATDFEPEEVPAAPAEAPALGAEIRPALQVQSIQQHTVRWCRSG
jgi:hypothetical protein